MKYKIYYLRDMSGSFGLSGVFNKQFKKTEIDELIFKEQEKIFHVVRRNNKVHCCDEPKQNRKKIFFTEWTAIFFVNVFERENADNTADNVDR